jgi:two-component system, OmpR family, phosphate regulon sensor histidine kinase PhoR
MRTIPDSTLPPDTENSHVTLDIAHFGDRDGRRGALRIALVYLLVAGLWILFSDTLVALFVSDPKLITLIAIYKGWVFVIVTAMILHWLISRHLQEQVHTESRLHEQFDQMNTIFDSLQSVVYVADLETNELLYINKYGMAITGPDWRGKKCFEVLQAGQSDQCSFCTNERLVRDGKPQPDCVWEFLNTRTGLWYQCMDRAIRWTDGRLVRLEIALDITERKEMEQLKDGIISAVSHEMRTPLTAMMGFTEVLLESEVEPEQRKSYLSTIYKESRRLHELIGNFLDLQQMKADRIAYHFTVVPVLPLLQEASVVFVFNQEDHSIVIDCPASIPPLRGDEARLHQALSNLISNAIKYSPPGSTVTVGARSEGQEITIWVRDEGAGIPAGLQEKIFERFYRLDNTDRRLAGGTGLGLALVQEIVKAHNGRIRIDSAPGKGSVFYLTFPAGGENR